MHKETKQIIYDTLWILMESVIKIIIYSRTVRAIRDKFRVWRNNYAFPDISDTNENLKSVITTLVVF